MESTYDKLEQSPEVDATEKLVKAGGNVGREEDVEVLSRWSAPTARRARRAYLETETEVEVGEETGEHRLEDARVAEKDVGVDVGADVDEGAWLWACRLELAFSESASTRRTRRERCVGGAAQRGGEKGRKEEKGGARDAHGGER